MLAKTFAGILLGLSLSIALVAVAILLWPHSESVVMPMMVLVFFPLWIGIMAATFLFRSGVRAWTWLAVANLGAFAALWVVKHTMPGL